MPIIVSFCNTSFKAGKKLLSLAMYSGGDMFSKKYKLFSKVTSNDLGTFAVFDVIPTGVAGEESFKVAENWYNQFKEKKIEVHQEKSDTDEGR